MISFCIPFRSDDFYRVQACAYVCNYLQMNYPHAEIIIGNNEGEFNRSAARNRAAVQASGDMLAFVDADSVVPVMQLEWALNLAVASQWAFPYDSYVSLTQLGTERFYLLERFNWDGFPSNDDVAHVFPSDETPEPSVGGCVIVSRSAFELVHGYDERFIGWGFEDRAFAISLQKTLHLAPQITGPLYHLWHPAPETERFEQPYMRANQALWFRYRDANRDQLKELVDEH